MGRHGITRFFLFLCFFAALSMFLQPSAYAVGPDTLGKITEASPDECFFGVENENNQYPLPNGCTQGSQPKRNEAYVWGLTQFEDNIFFGTGANIMFCPAGISRS